MSLLGFAYGVVAIGTLVATLAILGRAVRRDPFAVSDLRTLLDDRFASERTRGLQLLTLLLLILTVPTMGVALSGETLGWVFSLVGFVSLSYVVFGLVQLLLRFDWLFPPLTKPSGDLRSRVIAYILLWPTLRSTSRGTRRRRLSVKR